MKRTLIFFIPIILLLSNKMICQNNQFLQIEELINKAVELDLFSGCVLVAKGDEILFKRAYGEANKDFNIKNTLETTFNIASGTKPFTSVAIMMMVQDKLVDLSAPVNKYLPDFPFGDKITLFHLLTHTSGLSHYSNEYIEQMHFVRGFDVFLQDFIYKEKLLFEPGTELSYSNSGVVVLGAIIEKVAGISYGEFLQKRIFNPLEMKNTFFRMPEEVIANRASGYKKKYSGEYIETSLDVCPPTSATGLRTTVEDLFKFVQAIHNNTLLTEKFKRIMFTPYLNDDLGPYALLWDVLDGGLYSESDNTVIGHRGGQEGFRTCYYYYTKDKYTIIIMSNYQTGHYLYKPIEAILLNQDYKLPKTMVDQFLYDHFKNSDNGEPITRTIDILNENDYHIKSPYTLNRAGYICIRENKIDIAIKFFKLNVQLFPKNANAYDSLAEGYMIKGDKKNSIENYLRCIELDPNNSHAKKMIEKMRTQ